MSVLSFYRSATAKIVTIPVVAFVVGLLLPGLLGYKLLVGGAERETHEKAQTILQLLASVPHYTDAKGGSRADTPLRREIQRRYETSRHEVSFVYRQAALNPTDPQNKADDYEARLLKQFAADPKLEQIEEKVKLKGQDYHVLAVPLSFSQDRCALCHKSPSIAPSWRTSAYGRKAGFGWKKGEVVGMDIVYVPSAYPLRQAAQIYWFVVKSVGALALLCCAVLIVRTHLLITRPANRILASCRAIRKGEWGTRFYVRFPDELAELAVAFQDTTVWLRERIAREEKLRALFQQFIPASVAAKALGKDADEVLVGTRHAVTVMILNIRNFKLLMDHLPPEETVTTLNEYFSEVNRVIVANQGMVSKYMGDSVMAIFGMPLGKENHALCAVRAALGIPAALQNLYVRLQENHGWELGVGIGISTGEPIVGSFGSSEHQEYTVLGDVVGEAHQLEAATKSVPEEDSILISEATYRCVMSDVHVFDLGEKTGANGATVHAYVVQGFRTEVRSSLAA